MEDYPPLSDDILDGLDELGIGEIIFVSKNFEDSLKTSVVITCDEEKCKNLDSTYSNSKELSAFLIEKFLSLVISAYRREADFLEKFNDFCQRQITH